MRKMLGLGDKAHGHLQSVMVETADGRWVLAATSAAPDQGSRFNGWLATLEEPFEPAELGALVLAGFEESRVLRRLPAEPPQPFHTLLGFRTLKQYMTGRRYVSVGRYSRRPGEILIAPHRNTGRYFEGLGLELDIDSTADPETLGSNIIEAIARCE